MHLGLAWAVGWGDLENMSVGSPKSAAPVVQALSILPYRLALREWGDADLHTPLSSPTPRRQALF